MTKTGEIVHFSHFRATFSLLAARPPESLLLALIGKEIWWDTPWCAPRLSRGHVPSVPSYVPSVPGTFCPFSIDLHINQAQMSQVSLGRPEFVPGTPPGHIPTAKFLYVIFLGQESCSTKVSPNFSNFRPEFCPEFHRIFRGFFVPPFVGDGDQKKFTKNPRHFSMQNSQANAKNIFTKFFWRAGKVRFSLSVLFSPYLLFEFFRGFWPCGTFAPHSNKILVSF